jgi:hypothetical protein
MTKKIGVFRMNSGEEVVSEYKVNDDADYPFTLIKPQILAPMNDQNGGMSIAIIPLILSNPEGSIKIKASAIQGKLEEVPSRLESQYLQRTSSIDLTTKVASNIGSVSSIKSN